MHVPRPGSQRFGLARLAILVLLMVAPGASAQISRNVTLLSHLQQYPEYSACWSYVHSDGREYVVINATNGASIVRLTDPANPVEVAFIPLVNTIWHEVKQYRNYLYVTTDGYAFNGHRALEIIDMRDPDRPRRVGDFNPDLGQIHTVSVDENRGLLFLNGMPPDLATVQQEHDFKRQVAAGEAHLEPGYGSMHIYSLADPEHPAEIAVYNEYVHDFHVRGTRGYASLIYDGFVSVLDLTDPAHPVELTRWQTPNKFTHSAWTSENGRFLYVCDETPGPNSLSAWDITDIYHPRLTYLHQELDGEIPHNPRVKGNSLYISHYTAGMRVWDISNPAWPVEYAWYDTYPGPNGGYNGLWEVTPYYPSGISAGSDIQTGLYVFRVAPRNYGIVRGTVRDGSAGPPLAGVLVTAQPGGRTFRTHTDGTFAFALDPGSYTLTFSVYRFDDLTRSVNNVTVGSDKTLSISMKRSPSGPVQGIVSSNGAPLAEALVTLDGFESIFRAVSDASGAYRIDQVPVGTYTARCLRPGFVPAAQAVSVTTSGATASYPLTAAAFYDDAETDRGWTLSDLDDTATRGLWIRAVPLLAVVYSGQVMQPGADHTPAPGTMCFVTGNTPDTTQIFLGAVINGKVSLTSPVVSLAGLADPRVGFWAWYTNEFEDSGAIPDDSLTTLLSGDGGLTWVAADKFPRNTRGWRYFEIPVRSTLPTATSVRVKVVVADVGPDINVLECTLDDFAVYSGGAGPSPGLAPAFVSRTGARGQILWRGLGPIPSRGLVQASLELRVPAEVRAEVFNVQGRRIRSIRPGFLDAGIHAIAWDGRSDEGARVSSGVYWLRIQALDEERTVKVVLAR